MAAMHIHPLNPKVYWDVSIAAKPVGRVVLELFREEAPVACASFVELLPRYKNTFFHRVIKNFMIQGGDIIHGQVDSYSEAGTASGELPSGPVCFDGNNMLDKMLDKMLDIMLTEGFLLCMVNGGTGDSNSQFFVTLAPSPHLQGKHLVVGRVTHGKAVLREVERVKTSAQNVPLQTELPVISDCGVWEDGDAVPVYIASYSPLGGDVYEEYPDDDTTIVKHSDDSAEVSRSVYRAASAIKDSGGLLYQAGQLQDSFFKYRKCMRYIMEYMPDPDQEPTNYAQYVDLKKKVYMNLLLVTLKMHRLRECVDYCSYLLDMELLAPEKAKTLYRMGSCMVADKKYKEAVTIFTTARSFSEDPAIEQSLASAQALLEAATAKEKAKYAKFFA